MINPDDIKAGYTLGHADAQILRDELKSSRVTGWSERHRNVISVALLMFINCVYDRAKYEAREGDNEAVDKFLGDAKDAEFIRGEFMEAPHD